MRYAKVRLRQGKEKAIIQRHPWVFSGAIQELPKGAEAGDIVAVYPGQGADPLAYGFYDPDSQIVVRLFHFPTATDPRAEVDAESEGVAAPVFDQAYWRQKLAHAWHLRASLRVGNNDTYRLLHAEGDFWPGVVADVYGGKMAVLQLRTPGSLRQKDMLVSLLLELGLTGIYLKNKSYTGEREGAEGNGWLTEPLTEPIIGLEHGLKFEIDQVTGQKTGFFIDQRENRQLLGQLSQGKTMLNAFAYSGGFSIYALAAGAKRVVSVDISPEACQLAIRNAELNGLSANHEAIAADCFDYLKQLEAGAFDLIILDPPAFAKNIRAVPNATRGYKEINLVAMKKLPVGGILATFSCSQHIDRDLFRKIVFGAAVDAGREVRILHQLTQPMDHPVSIYHPEGEYLKGLVLQVL